MEVKFLKQYPCMPSWPGVFQFGVLVTFFSCFLSIRLLCYVLFLPIFCSNIVLFPCHPTVGMSSCILPLLGRIFCCCFGMSYFFCTVLSCFDIFLVFLFSPLPSDLFPQIFVCFICVAFFFPSTHIPHVFPLFYFFVWCRRFLICVSCLISYPGFECLFVFFRRNTDFITD